LYDNVRLIHLDAVLPEANAQENELASLAFQALEGQRCAENIEYDLIHSHYWLSGIVGQIAAESWHRPHLMTYHTVGDIKENAHPTGDEPKQRLVHERQLAVSCDHIVVPTPREREFFNRRYGVPADRLWIVPCAVDLKRFCRADKTAARKALGLDLDTPLLLYVGRFVPIKGLDRLIDALGYQQERPSLRVILAGGDGPGSSGHRKILDRIAALELQETVILAGRLDQTMLPRYYSAADALVLPSYHESFGIVALESLACGTPVVSTPVGAMPSIIRDGINGMIVDGEDIRSFARQIETAVRNFRSRPVSPDDVRATVLDLTWENAADKLLKVYHVAANR